MVLYLVTSTVRALCRIGHRHQLADVRVARAGDEALRAVDDVVIALANGASFHGSGIGPGIRLGLHEAKLFLAP
jgi:glutamate synthase domain-containing protein 2